jgi:hypothetical protein
MILDYNHKPPHPLTTQRLRLGVASLAAAEAEPLHHPSHRLLNCSCKDPLILTCDSTYFFCDSSFLNETGARTKQQLCGTLNAIGTDDLDISRSFVVHSVCQGHKENTD